MKAADLPEHTVILVFDAPHFWLPSPRGSELYIKEGYKTPDETWLDVKTVYYAQVDLTNEQVDARGFEIVAMGLETPIVVPAPITISESESNVSSEEAPKELEQ